MQKELARTVSIVLSPFVLAVVGGFFFSYKEAPTPQEALFWTGVVTLYTAIVALYILYGVKKGFFSNLDITNRKERFMFYPFLISTLFAFTATAFILNGPTLLKVAGIFLIPTIFLFELLNEKIKGSIHTANVTAATVGFSLYYGGIFYLLLLLIPLVIWSRVKTHKHTLSETIVGGAYGAVFAIIGVFIVQFFYR